MTVYVKVDGRIMAVPSGVVRIAAYRLLNKASTPAEMREYLSGQKLAEPATRVKELGYVDFDNLEDEKPTISGNFFRKNTVFGRRLYGLPLPD